MFKLLIADDEIHEREYLKHVLPWGELGIELCGAAKNGNEALEIALRERPDLALLDINMPGLSGLELLDALNRADQDLVVGFVTGYSEFEYAKQAVKLGADEYILKPFSPEEMREAVEHLLKERRKRNESQKRPTETEKTEAAADTAEARGATRRAKDIIRAVNQLLEEQYTDPELSSQKIADALFLDVSYVRRIFAKNVGCTLTDYLTEYRMKKAAELLRQEEYAVGQVSEYVGYVDSGYFTKCFKKHFGVSPSRFRQEQGAWTGDGV